jgi:hypothetical protein
MSTDIANTLDIADACLLTKSLSKSTGLAVALSFSAVSLMNCLAYEKNSGPPQIRSRGSFQRDIGSN